MGYLDSNVGPGSRSIWGPNLEEMISNGMDTAPSLPRVSGSICGCSFQCGITGDGATKLSETGVSRKTLAYYVLYRYPLRL